ncbi:3-hydroxyacyl-CoA dehydrogenase NAD-binding domain-containing protein [Marinobacterium zhoushanense]|nr:3-hydroxyacyl-CoA dehydrogenase NAD-binding domain-containing protein [Marinobacterium zhoushanense]
MQGQYVRVVSVGDGLYELVFDNRLDDVNTLSQACINEFGDAVMLLRDAEGLRGVVISSDHEDFILGGDASEFDQHARMPNHELIALLEEMKNWLTRLEQLPVPTVAACGGDASGGGFELTLACDYRVMSSDARVRLPHVRRGLIPGWGGTVRLPRVVGLDSAIDWICTGRYVDAREALQTGLANVVVSPSHLREAALDLLRRCADGEFDFQARRQSKQQALPLSKLALTLAVESARGRIARIAGKHNPAAIRALDTLLLQAPLSVEQAMEVEAQHYAELAGSEITPALTSLFRSELQTKQRARAELKRSDFKRVGVLGAGVMGRAIAAQAALSQMRVVMLDAKDQQLVDAMEEISSKLSRLVERKKLDAEERVRILTRIRPALSREEFVDVDLAIEAVIEDPGVKSAALLAVEKYLPEHAILATNTSAIPVGGLARGLKRPEQFCGIHFFNPVSTKPLVEVVRAAKTSDETVRRALGFAKAMGKTPVVVRDCPGFFVNRVLHSYLQGFLFLLRDGVDPYRVDRLMEEYGWSLGPARTLDKLGIDTSLNASRMLAAAYPERLSFPGESALDRLRVLRRLGRKSGLGFYRYVHGAKYKGLPDLNFTAELEDLVVRHQEVSDREIIERMMIPLKIEAARVLEEGNIGSPAEADVALVLGIGYPAFRGGAFFALDREGLGRFVARCQKYKDLGPIYLPGLQLREMASGGRSYREWGQRHEA